MALVSRLASVLQDTGDLVCVKIATLCLAPGRIDTIGRFDGKVCPLAGLTGVDGASATHHVAEPAIQGHASVDAFAPNRHLQMVRKPVEA